MGDGAQQRDLLRAVLALPLGLAQGLVRALQLARLVRGVRGLLLRLQQAPVVLLLAGAEEAPPGAASPSSASGQHLLVRRDPRPSPPLVSAPRQQRSRRERAWARHCRLEPVRARRARLARLLVQQLLRLARRAGA